MSACVPLAPVVLRDIAKDVEDYAGGAPIGTRRMRDGEAKAPLHCYAQRPRRDPESRVAGDRV